MDFDFDLDVGVVGFASKFEFEGDANVVLYIREDASVIVGTGILTRRDDSDRNSC